MSKTRSCAEAFPPPPRACDPEHLRPPEQVMRNVLEHAVSGVFGIDGDHFWGVTRGPPQAAFARQVGMYLAHVSFGLSLTEVGQLFARDRTTVAHACTLVEDRRDDRCFDHSLELLESAIRLLRPSALPAPLARLAITLPL